MRFQSLTSRFRVAIVCCHLCSEGKGQVLTLMQKGKNRLLVCSSTHDMLEKKSESAQNNQNNMTDLKRMEAKATRCVFDIEEYRAGDVCKICTCI